MKYYIFVVDDAGAIEDCNEKIIKGKRHLICKLYDDDEFNTVNDFIHSVNNTVLSGKALNIIKNHNSIPYELTPIKLLKKEKVLGLIKTFKPYNNYYELKFIEQDKQKIDEYYHWINFDKSEVFAINSLNKKIKIKSHQHKLDLINENKLNSKMRYEIENSDITEEIKNERLKEINTNEFEVKKIVFGKKFDNEIDLFRIPLYSWGIYISERLKNELTKEQITGIDFAEDKEELGFMWKPNYPIIEFEN